MKQHKGKRAYALAMLIAFAPSATTFAQEEVFLDEGVDVYNSEQIDIDGSYDRRDSAANRISEMRKKLERENDELMKNKIEGIRIEQEQELAERLNGSLSGNSNNNSYDDRNYDEVGVLNAAPVRVETVVEEEKSSNLKNKITPYVGLQNFNGDRIDSFDSNASVGLQFENMLTNYFSVGLGASYTTMDITYLEDTSIFNYYGQIGYSSSNADEIDYRNLNINANAKLFLSASSKIKPFIGGQVGFNRTSLRFTERSQQFLGFYDDREEDTKVSSSNVTATGIVGVEFGFNDNVAMTADFRYTQAITSGFDSASRRFNNVNQVQADKEVLEDIGSRLENSDIASINLGLTVKF